MQAVLSEILAAEPDVLVLQGVDYDLQGAALKSLAEALALGGLNYPHLFAAAPNAGRMTDLDLDGDGRTGGPGDAQGYGRFFGQGSMALLSRHPIAEAEVADYSTFLWRDLPGAFLPEAGGQPFPDAQALEVQRLSSHGHWVVPILHPVLGRVDILTYHATPPVFDGPEDRNGRRNHDETAFWLHLLEGRIGTAPQAPFVLLGDANIDPDGGEGIPGAITALLAHPTLQDPLGPRPTVDWAQTGPLRVSYILPSADWRVLESGIRPHNPAASRHALVWVTLAR